MPNVREGLVVIKTYTFDQYGLKKAADFQGKLANLVWIDLDTPSHEEKALIERAYGIEIPTRDEIQEIESSVRFRQVNSAIYATLTVISRNAPDAPKNIDVTFILVSDTMITLRYGEVEPFRRFSSEAALQAGMCSSAEVLYVGLLEGIVEYVSDILVTIGAERDAISNAIFRNEKPQGNAFHDILRRIGLMGDMASKVYESLLSSSRLFVFLTQTRAFQDESNKTRLRVLASDVLPLNDHAVYLSNKVNFMLDATLGMINIEQNNIIKLFTVAATGLMPPTLIASIYGMNFKIIPELQWEYGYFYALMLMVCSSILPFWYFKRKGWL
ncbi:MAG: magnesium transporter CorA family protein [Burkholderiales bacterium]